MSAGRLQIAGCKDEGTCNKIVRHVVNCLNSIYEGSRDGAVTPPPPHTTQRGKGLKEAASSMLATATAP